jgi:hypothetical protein
METAENSFLRNDGRHGMTDHKHNKNVRGNIYCDMMAENLSSGARATRPLLSNGSEITFPLQRIAAIESLPGNKLLSTRFL